MGTAERTPRQGTAAGAPQTEARHASSPTIPGANPRSRGSGPRPRTKTLIFKPFGSSVRPPASESKIQPRSGAEAGQEESQEWELTQLADAWAGETELDASAPEGALVEHSALKQNVAASRAPRWRAIAAISVVVIVGSSLAAWVAVHRHTNVWVVQEEPPPLEIADSPGSIASDYIPGLVTGRLTPTAQPEASGTRLQKHAPGKQPSAPRRRGAVVRDEP
jgi:hypothetical protein